MKKIVLSVLCSMGLLVGASSFASDGGTHQSDNKGVLLNEILKANGVPKDIQGEIASKVSLSAISLGANFVLRLESPEQVKNDLLASATTGANARYTIG